MDLIVFLFCPVYRSGKMSKKNLQFFNVRKAWQNRVGDDTDLIAFEKPVEEWRHNNASPKSQKNECMAEIAIVDGLVLSGVT